MRDNVQRKRARRAGPAAELLQEAGALRRSRRGFGGSFDGIDDNRLLPALCRGGVDRAQVDTLLLERRQALRQGSRLVGELVLFRGRFLIRDVGGVQRLLGFPGVFGNELNRAARSLRRSQKGQDIHLRVPQGFRDARDSAGLIVNDDRELLGFGHVRTSQLRRLYASKSRDAGAKRERGVGDLQIFWRTQNAGTLNLLTFQSA